MPVVLLVYSKQFRAVSCVAASCPVCWTEHIPLPLWSVYIVGDCPSLCMLFADSTWQKAWEVLVVGPAKRQKQCPIHANPGVHAKWTFWSCYHMHKEGLVGCNIRPPWFLKTTLWRLRCSIMWKGTVPSFMWTTSRHLMPCDSFPDR